MMKRRITGQIKNYNTLFLQLDEEMKRISNKKRSLEMSKYMRNQFSFLGITSPQRKELYKEFSKNYKIETIEELKEWLLILWEQEYREYQLYAIMDLIKYKQLLVNQEMISFIINQLVLKKSWWDTVDCIASTVIGGYYINRFDELTMNIPSLIQHENMWVNRTAILIQLKYKEKCNVTLLDLSIQPHLQSNEFFIQKSIGWMLREYGKTNPNWVKSYVENNNLKPLSRREALKHLK